MFCIPNTDSCIDPVVVLCILGIVAIFVAIAVYVKLVRGQTQTSDKGISHRVTEGSPTDAPGPYDKEEDETPTPKIGNKVLFDKIGGMTCFLVVAKVDDDEEEVHGKFVVELPFDATNINPHYDSDNDEVIVEYDLGISHGLEIYFRVADPIDEDALAGYSWIIDGVEAEAKSA